MVAVINTKIFIASLPSDRGPIYFRDEQGPDFNLEYWGYGIWNNQEHWIINIGGKFDLDLGGRPPRSKRLKWIFGWENPKKWKLEMPEENRRMPKKQHHKEKPTDMDLNKNATKCWNNHIQKDAAEIMMHFINGKYWIMLTTRNGNKAARVMVAYL